MRFGDRSGRAVSLADSARYLLRSRLLNHPRLGLWYLSQRSVYDELRLSASTQIVIDGFPRSANSYARWAFVQSVGHQEALAGHAHSSALLVEGARRGLPAVVVVRAPAAAVGSLVQMGPPHRLDVGTALKEYTRFHENLLPVREGLVVARFEDVVRDFGGVIQKVNERFGTTFPLFAGTEDAVGEVNALLEAANQRHNRGALNEASVSRPSASRVPGAAVVAQAGARAQRHLRSAERVYQRMVGS